MLSTTFRLQARRSPLTVRSKRHFYLSGVSHVTLPANCCPRWFVPRSQLHSLAIRKIQQQQRLFSGSLPVMVSLFDVGRHWERVSLTAFSQEKLG